MPKPPRKPTEPHAVIAFSKDGKVRKEETLLPPTKEGQEQAIAERFATRLAQVTGRAWSWMPLDEANHDFELSSEEEKVLVQAIEVVPKRDYLSPIPDGEDWSDGQAQMMPDGSIMRVDLERYHDVLGDKIRKKLAKHYAKPKIPLWLLIWTVDSGFFVSGFEGGVLKVTPGVLRAWSLLESTGAGPFDQIWFLPPFTNPYRIWPKTV